MLLLKLTLVPAFLYLLALVARYYGPHRAGWMAGLPVVAGPILWLLMQEHGTDFAARAAMQAIAAIAASELFNLVYARCATRSGWPLTLAAALCGWLLAALLLQGLTLTLPSALAMAGLAVLINSICLPGRAQACGSHKRDPGLAHAGSRRADLAGKPGRKQAGCKLERVLAVFPLLAVVMAVATQRMQGTAAVQALLRGMLLGRLSFAGFCLALVCLLPRLEGNLAFAGHLISIGLQLQSRRLLPA
jgi:hypothetical protein